MICAPMNDGRSCLLLESINMIFVQLCNPTFSQFRTLRNYNNCRNRQRQSALSHETPVSIRTDLHVVIILLTVTLQAKSFYFITFEQNIPKSS